MVICKSILEFFFIFIKLMRNTKKLDHFCSTLDYSEIKKHGECYNIQELWKLAGNQIELPNHEVLLDIYGKVSSDMHSNYPFCNFSRKGKFHINFEVFMH